MQEQIDNEGEDWGSDGGQQIDNEGEDWDRTQVNNDGEDWGAKNGVNNDGEDWSQPKPTDKPTPREPTPEPSPDPTIDLITHLENLKNVSGTHVVSYAKLYIFRAV